MPNNRGSKQSPANNQNSTSRTASNHAMEPLHTPQGNRSSRRLRSHNHQPQAPSPQQQLQHLRERLARTDERNAALKEEIEAYHETLEGYRITIEDKSAECVELKHKVADLEQRMSSAPRAAGWSLANILPGSRDGRRLAEEEQIARLRLKLEKCREAHESRKERILQLEQQATAHDKQLQAQTLNFARELDEVKSKYLVKAPIASDSEIQGEWQALGCVINQFVLRYLKGPLDPSRIAQLAQHEMFRWLPEIASALPVPLIRSVIFESWIWHFLCFRVFDAGSEVWAGKTGKAFGFLCHQLRPRESHYSTRGTASIEQFHDWRVRSAHLISQLGSHDPEDAVKGSAHEMLNALGHVTPSTLSHAEIEDMHQDALDIVSKAAELDRIFRLSRADFQVFITRLKLPLPNPPVFGFGFDSETMEPVKSLPIPIGDDPMAIVDLAVSPGVFKAGNADGENYGAERVLVKLQAFCGLKGLLDFFGGVEQQTKGEAMEEEREIKAEPSDAPDFIKHEPGEEDDVDLVRSAQPLR